MQAPKLPIYSGGPSFADYHKMLILTLKSTQGCYHIAIDAKLNAAPAD
eukprot:gene26339-17436_t